MKWLNKLSRYSNYTKCSSGLSKSNYFLGQWVSRSSINDKVENKFVSDLGFFSSTPLKHNDPWIQKRGFRWWCYQDIPSSDLAASSCISSRSFGQTPRNESPLTREWLAKLWVEKSSGENTKRKRQRRALYVEQHATYFNENHSFFRLSFDGLKKKLFHHIQPAISQSDQEYLEPTSSKEAKVAHLLTRSNLLITRDIEWANLMWGFEQENRYAIVDACYPQSPVGYIREQSNIIFRQFLRTRRPFIAYITDAMGNELFRVRRPFWWINSTIFAEIAGKEIGVVHRRWHLWRRVYDLYLGDKQFAVVENPGFWNWTFTLKDEENNVLAEIDRNWRGVGFELFTDAGQYVIRFGLADPGYKTAPAESVQELETVRPLTLSERAVAVALAISLDNDYFSRHGGWGMPFIAVGGE